MKSTAILPSVFVVLWTPVIVDVACSTLLTGRSMVLKIIPGYPAVSFLDPTLIMDLFYHVMELSTGLWCLCSFLSLTSSCREQQAGAITQLRIIRANQGRALKEAGTLKEASDC
ncbi:hypothetical protein ILYODFUR_000344 [Ilyodon furcidens]|uniref:Uncharacterized protein n=1 Tax=Ilyodon furcidens TaxID=33524 RepID=A0ABV0ST11_9TELE